MKQVVRHSDLNIYFDDLTEELPIWVLDQDEAEPLWRRTFDARSTVLFNLPDDSWVQTERGVDVGDWRPCLNEKDFEPFRQSLSAGVPWRAQDEVLFAAILQLRGKHFCRIGKVSSISDPTHRYCCRRRIHDNVCCSFQEAARRSSTRASLNENAPSSFKAFGALVAAGTSRLSSAAMKLLKWSHCSPGWGCEAACGFVSCADRAGASVKPRCLTPRPAL